MDLRCEVFIGDQHLWKGHEAGKGRGGGSGGLAKLDQCGKRAGASIASQSCLMLGLHGWNFTPSPCSVAGCPWAPPLKLPLDSRSGQSEFLNMTCKAPSQPDRSSCKELFIISATQTISQLQTLIYINTFSNPSLACRLAGSSFSPFWTSAQGVLCGALSSLSAWEWAPSSGLSRLPAQPLLTPTALYGYSFAPLSLLVSPLLDLLYLSVLSTVQEMLNVC